MSCVEVFSYALLLKGAERGTQIIELLDEGKQEEVKAALESLKDIPAAGIRQLWCERRRADELSISDSL
ncbi:MAG: hypothetical protein JO138_02985 [Acidobacteriaceae bacterium]|nr:hypothetical protein [Acidobacteriota bacterium]MBV9498318.1 hypothetical protein [Acidobacteriaceae bacterium]